MNIVNLYRKIKQILNDSNIALVNKGLNSVGNLYDILAELSRININRLPYALSKQIIEATEDDLVGVTSIGYGAFWGCASLASVTIPDGVTSIGNRAFGGCTSLTDIYLKPTTPPSLGNTNAIPTTTTIHIPIGSGDAYKSATNWSYYSSRIVEDIEV